MKGKEEKCGSSGEALSMLNCQYISPAATYLPSLSISLPKLVTHSELIDEEKRRTQL